MLTDNPNPALRRLREQAGKPPCANCPSHMPGGPAQ
jgi:hypothetical protein